MRLDIDDLKTLARSQLYTLRGEQYTAGGAGGGPAKIEPGYRAGQIIDSKYKIISRIGEGGMGAIYRAHHLGLEKDVALKTFRTPDLNPESVKRFQREAQAIAKLDHPNIVKVFDFGISEGNIPFYTMELLHGESLAERLASSGPLPVAEAAHVYMQVCQGLAQAHSKGVAHRDMKPGNIFLSADPDSGRETVKIVDFGIAGLSEHSLEGQKLTTSGTIFGSPLYMSPEQSMGSPITAASDVYSCGCALYETLTGMPPFRGDTAFATMVMHQQDKPPALVAPPGAPAYPQRLVGLVARMLEKSPDARFQSMLQVEDELAKIISGVGVGRRFAVSSRGDGEQAAMPEAGSKSSGPAFPGVVVVCLALALVIVAGTAINIGLGKKASNTAGRVFQAVPGSMPSVPRDKELDAIASTQPVVDVKTYRVSGPEGAAGPRVFEFPKNVSVGNLSWTYREGVDGPASPAGLQAIGHKVIPAGAQLRLTVGQEVSNDPGLLRGFRPSDLYALTYSAILLSNWEGRHLEYLGHLSRLNQLFLNDISEFTDANIRDLNKVVGLFELFINNSGITGDGLAALTRLRELRVLSANKIRHISAALAKLKGSTAIRGLALEECDLNASDLKRIAMMPNLTDLSLNGNSNIRDEDLEIIAKMPSLKILAVRRTGLTFKCLGTLAKMHLTKLAIDYEKMSQHEQDQLRRTLKNCELLRREDKTSEK